jgi:arabinose-5-phosphate isomerase
MKTISVNSGNTKTDAQDTLERAKKVFESESRAILTAAECLGSDFVATVDAILTSTGRVCTTGMGKAGLIARKVQATLASTGTLSYPLDPYDAFHGDLGMVHSSDIVLAFSKTGSPEMAKLLGILRGLGCTVALVTAESRSSAAEQSHFILDIGTSPEACPLGLAPSSSTAAMLALGDALALVLMDKRHMKPEHYARFHPGGSLGRSLMRVSEIMRTGEDCPRLALGATLEDLYAAISRSPRRSGAACVVNDDGVLEGLLSHGDVFRAVLHGGKTTKSRVDEVMTRTPMVVADSAPVTDAMAFMRRYQIDDLPVVDCTRRVVGLIDIQDVVAAGFHLDRDGAR